MEKPPEIQKSIIEGNEQHLSQAGRKGGKMAYFSKEIKRIAEEESIEERKRELREHSLILEYGEEEARRMLDEQDQ